MHTITAFENPETDVTLEGRCHGNFITALNIEVKDKLQKMCKLVADVSLHTRLQSL